MGIQDGNLFEAMRLVLPEHRDKMKVVEKELQKRSKPKLSEDALREMADIFAECAANGQTVRITLFDEYEDDVWIGVPLIRNGRLFLQRGRELWPLPTERVVYIESL